MRLLLDQCLARSVAALLRSRGVDAVHVAEYGLSTAEDLEIIEKALATGRAIITMNGDFHANLASSHAPLPSVVRIRIQGLDEKAAADLIHRVGILCREDILKGAAISVQSANLRIRHLPLEKHDS